VDWIVRMGRLTPVVGCCKARTGVLDVLGVRTLRAEVGVRRVGRMVAPRRVGCESGAEMRRKAGQRTVRPVRTLPDWLLAMGVLVLVLVLLVVMLMLWLLWLRRRRE